MMKKWHVFLVSLLLVCLFGSTALADSTAVIDGGTADRVHLRAAPDMDADSLGLYFTGTEVTCLSDPESAWVLVQIGAETGYMMGQYLIVSKQPVAIISNIAKNDAVSIYSVPQDRSAVVGFAGYGLKVTVLGETKDGWYYVQYGDDRGYVRVQYLKWSN